MSQESNEPNAEATADTPAKETQVAAPAENTAENELTETELHEQLILFNANGGWMVARGVLGVLFAIVAAFWPREQLGSVANLTVGVSVVDWLIFAFIALNALMLAVQGFASTHLRMMLWGQAVVSIPAMMFLVMADSAGQLRAAVAVWAVLYGAIELWMWRGLRGTRLATDHLYAGAAYVLVGLIIAFGSSMGPLTIMGFTSVAAVVSGVLYIIGGFSRRAHARA